MAHFRLLITFTMAVLLAFCAERVHAGAWPKEVRVYQGSTPQLDGVIAPGEYDDAAQLDDFSELIEKLAALVPPPRLNLVRYHGVLAPNAGFRRLVVPSCSVLPDA